MDHKKLETFLRHIEFFNAQLRGTLHHTEQSHYAGVSCDTLRSLISHTTDKAVLSLITDKLSLSGFTATTKGNVIVKPYTASATISAAASGTLSNTATVTAPAGVTDPTPGNNSA